MHSVAQLIFDCLLLLPYDLPADRRQDEADQCPRRRRHCEAWWALQHVHRLCTDTRSRRCIFASSRVRKEDPILSFHSYTKLAFIEAGIWSAGALRIGRMQITEEVRCAVGARQQTGGTNPVVSDQGVREHYPGAQGAHLRLVHYCKCVGNFCRAVSTRSCSIDASLRPPKRSQRAWYPHGALPASNSPVGFSLLCRSINRWQLRRLRDTS